MMGYVMNDGPDDSANRTVFVMISVHLLVPAGRMLSRRTPTFCNFKWSGLYYEKRSVLLFDRCSCGE